jgi:transcriptional regulator with XRE-family HTH domain
MKQIDKPIERIRKEVFGVSQVAFAEIAGTTQGSVSRWENGDQKPDLTEMDSIRKHAHEMGIARDDRWFFELPQPATDFHNIESSSGDAEAAA